VEVEWSAHAAWAEAKESARDEGVLPKGRGEERF
jgi:hypothetical protein